MSVFFFVRYVFIECDMQVFRYFARCFFLLLFRQFACSFCRQLFRQLLEFPSLVMSIVNSVCSCLCLFGVVALSLCIHVFFLFSDVAIYLFRQLFPSCVLQELVISFQVLPFCLSLCSVFCLYVGRYLCRWFVISLGSQLFLCSVFRYVFSPFVCSVSFVMYVFVIYVMFSLVSSCFIILFVQLVRSLFSQFVSQFFMYLASSLFLYFSISLVLDVVSS